MKHSRSRIFSTALLILSTIVLLASAPASADEPKSLAPLKLICETVTPAKVGKKALPPSCDAVCADKGLTCVWNTAPINPNGCDAPAYQACRCCGVEARK